MDRRRQRSILGPHNSSCIDIWAPGGGLADAITGAAASSPTAYTEVIPRAFGASWLVAGIAAQYLQYKPTASVAELKSALVGLATRDAVPDAGSAAPNLLAFTNLTEHQQQQVTDDNAGHSSSHKTLLIAVLVPVLTIGESPSPPQTDPICEA